VTAAVLALAVSRRAEAQTSEVVAGQTVIALPDTAGYSAAQRRILALERERSSAIARHDTAWLATLYAPDFAGVAANGSRVDRAALFRVFSRDAPDARFAIDELSVRDLGSAATVSGRLRTLGPDGAVAGESRYLHVYVRRDGHWWLVAAEGTAVQR
jgi:ketosteroid isomerase-like protein